jgi:hypothetical protein
LDDDASAARIVRVICAGCGEDLGRPERLGRRDACPRCRADLRCCRQCRFYDRTLADACREIVAVWRVGPSIRPDARLLVAVWRVGPSIRPDARLPQAERVVDKTRGNFCDSFSPAESAPVASGSSSDAAPAALDRLFTRR